MLPSYSSPLILRALRSPLCRAPPAARFSVSALQAESGAIGFNPLTPLILLYLTQLYPLVSIEETPSPITRTKLPYFVHRSSTNNLPVYLEKRTTLRRTRIRKVEGDANALRDDLIRELNLQPELVTINGLTNHILIKGWVKENVDKLLIRLNF